MHYPSETMSIPADTSRWTISDSPIWICVDARLAVVAFTTDNRPMHRSGGVSFVAVENRLPPYKI